MKYKFIHIVLTVLYVSLFPCSIFGIVNTTTSITPRTMNVAGHSSTIATNSDAEAFFSPEAQATKNPRTIGGQSPGKMVAQVSEARVSGSSQTLALNVYAGEMQQQIEYVQVVKSEMPLRQVFNEIQKQTGYKVAVNWAGISPETKVRIKTGRIPVLEFLEQALRDTELEYYLEGKYILISRVPKKSSNPENHVTDESVADLVELQEAPNPLEEIVPPDIDTAKLILVEFDMDQLRPNNMNKENVKALQGLDNLFSDGDLVERLDYINITALPSPDKQTLFNDRTARRRAQLLKTYISDAYPFLDEDRIYILLAEEDWKGLEQLIAHDPGMPYQEDVLKLLSNPISNEQKKERLKTMSGGVVHRYLVSNILPKMADGAAYTVHFRQEPVIAYVDTGAEKLLADSASIESVVETPVVNAEEVKLSDKPQPLHPLPVLKKPAPIIYIGLKNDIVYDALLLPNMGIEFAFGKRYSFVLEGAWSWGTYYSKTHYYMKAAGARGELRWWLNSFAGPMNREYVGVYFDFGQYDIRINRTRYQTENYVYGAGLTLGYSLPLAKRLNLDFGVSVGFRVGQVKTLYLYDPANNLYKEKGDNKQNMFGPSRANVSLVWLIGNGYNNNTKRRGRDTE